jgi:membrane-associated protease RseP (regulator of RpoE activity)
MRPSVRRTSSHAPSLNPGGGSKDFTSGIVNEVPQKGPNQNGRNSVDPAGGNGSLPAKDVLSTKGADVGSGWTLGNVKKGSSAERSGLKPGDVVEAIDDKPVSDKSSANGKFAGRSVRVRRDGKTVRIDLKP